MADYPAQTHHYDLENPDDLVRLNQPKLVLEQLRGLVVIDEVQRVPELFPLLRVLADRPDVDTRFLLLGSASPELLQQSSESLAGRIAYHDLTGFNLSEVGADKVEQLWWRGGFPRAFLAPSERSSNEWRRNFIRTFLDRDLPQLGVRVPAATMHRFWQMLAHYHGQIWNGAELARAFGVAQSTVRHYLDILSGALVVRQLLPWYANLKKRQVKSSKVYLADTGLLHGLLGLKSRAELLSHPKVGASWEGFVISEVLAKLQALPEEAYFWSTHAHAELDLLIARGNTRLGFEDKETLIKSTVTANCCVMRCSECSHMPEYAALSALGKPFIRLAAIALYSTQRFTQSLPELSSLYVKVSTKVLPIVAATVFSLYGCGGGGGGGSSSNNNNGGDPVDPTCTDNQTLVNGECVDNEPIEPTTYSQSDLISYLSNDSTNVELATDSQGLVVDSFSYETTSGATLMGYALIPRTNQDEILASLDGSGTQVLNPYTSHVLAVDEQTYSGLDLTLKDTNQVQTQDSNNINTFLTQSGVVGVYSMPSEEMTEEEFTNQKEAIESILNNNVVLSTGLNLFAYGDNGDRRPIGHSGEMPGTIEHTDISGGYTLGANIDTTQILVYNQDGIDTNERILLGDHYSIDGNSIKLHEYEQGTGTFTEQGMFKFENLNNGIYNLFMNGTNKNGENVLVYVGTLDKDSNCFDGLYQVDPNDEGPTYDCTS